MSWALTWAAGCNTCALDTTPNGLYNWTPMPAQTATCYAPAGNWGKYRLEDFLIPMQGKVLPMRKVFDTQAQGVTNLLFDVQANPDPENWQASIKFLFKNLDGVNLDDMQQGTYITRWEWYYKEQEFVVTQDYATPTNTITIGTVDSSGVITPWLGSDYSGNPIIKVWSELQIFQNDPADPDPDCTANIIQKTVIATDTTTGQVTLETGTPSAWFTFREWDRVRKLYHTRNDCEVITNTFDIIPNNAYRSYTQHFDYRITFTKKELNTAYATPRGAVDAVLNRIYHGNLALVRSIANAAFFGRNRDMAWTQKGQTMGIYTEINRVAAAWLDVISSAANATGDADLVNLMLNEILAVQNSWIVNQGDDIVILCNQNAINALMKVQQAFNHLTWFTVNTNEKFRKSFGLPIIETPMGSVEYMTDRVLSDTFKHEWVVIIMPKKSIAVRSRKYKEVNIAMNWQLVRRELWIEIKDVTANDKHECKEYDVMTELNIMVMGADSWAIRMITGIKDNC